MQTGKRRGGGSYDQNIGTAGVVYILENDGLRLGWIKIGCSSRSGDARARDLNFDANTGTPGTFRCVFEVRTLDCGRAERQVFQELAAFRRGKRGQEFFEVDLLRAQAVIRRVCAAIDDEAERRQPPAPSPAPRPLPTAPLQSPHHLHAMTATDPTPRPVHASPIRLRWVLLAVLAVWMLWPKSKPPAKRIPALPIASASVAPAAKPTAWQPVPQRGKRDMAAPKGAADGRPDEATANKTLASNADDLASRTEAAHRAAETRPGPNVEPSAASTSGSQSSALSAPSRAVDDATDASTTGTANSTSRSLSEADLSADERHSLQAVCSHAKYSQGPAAFLSCVDRHLRALVRGPRQPDLSGLGADERHSLSAACSAAKFTEGPVALNRCVERQLASLTSAPRSVDVSRLSAEERSSLEAACSREKYTSGPAAYNECRRRLLASLESTPQPLDLSALTEVERRSMSAACSQAKYTQGPAALRDCLAKQYESLKSAPGPTDLSQFPRDVKVSIESVCSHAKYALGPAQYNRCVEKQVSLLRGFSAGVSP